MCVSLYSFNMLTYSSSVNLWRKEYVSVTKENTNAAVQWLERVRADGCSCLLHALKVCDSVMVQCYIACSIYFKVSLESGVDNIYLITDGTAVSWIQQPPPLYNNQHIQCVLRIHRTTLMSFFSANFLN